MTNNKWCLFCGILAIGLIFALSTTASAANPVLRNTTIVDEGAVQGGQVLSGPGASGQNGDVVYQMERLSGYFFRPFPGYRDYDDIHAESGGELIEYRISVFGSTVSGSQAGSAFDATTRLYTDTTGNPDGLSPDANFIPGTECSFVGVPPGGVFTLTCKVAAGITIPDAFWAAIEFSTDNAGWLIADFDADINPQIGHSDDSFLELDLGTGLFSQFFFGGCGANPCASMIVRVVTTGQPWACCDPSTFACSNVQETQCDIFSTQIFTQGTLCNDLDPPCSESGACCDIATGACSNTFASLCQGFTQSFTAGADCSAVECVEPDNVPTVTQWGMIVLTATLLVGLTIKFGRRRTATA